MGFVLYMGIARNEKNKLGELYNLTLDSMDIAVSIIDTKGTLLYYNRQSARVLDRKPEYIGSDIHLHHQEAANEKLDQMLKDFENGRTKPYTKAILFCFSLYSVCS